MSQMRPLLWLTRTPAAGKAQYLFPWTAPSRHNPLGPYDRRKITSADVLEPLAAMHVQMVAETRIDSGRTMWQMIEITIYIYIYTYTYIHIHMYIFLEVDTLIDVP